MVIRDLRLPFRSLVVVGLISAVVIALMLGFDVINGGYSEADIQIGY